MTGSAAARPWCSGCRDLGVDVTWEQVAALAAGGSVGRPHIARAMVAAGRDRHAA